MINKIKNKKLYVLALITVICAILFYYFISPKDQTTTDDDFPVSQATTTSTSPTAQENFTEGTEREPGNSLVESRGSGYVEENSASNGATTSQSAWSTSNTGEITLYSPLKNGTLKSGDLISGESTLSVVSFRLIDNISGVIAQGQLPVVNGKFSGTFNFQTNATEGRLDVFATDSQGGEFSNIEIPLKL